MSNTSHTSSRLASAARAAGYQVGLVRHPAENGHTGWIRRCPGHRYDNFVAMSIYDEGAEVARLAWARITADSRTRSVLAFSGLRSGEEFINSGDVYTVAYGLGLKTFAKTLTARATGGGSLVRHRLPA